jgi:hypothetical protein
MNASKCVTENYTAAGYSQSSQLLYGLAYHLITRCLNIQIYVNSIAAGGSIPRPPFRGITPYLPQGALGRPNRLGSSQIPYHFGHPRFRNLNTPMRMANARDVKVFRILCTCLYVNALLSQKLQHASNSH